MSNNVTCQIAADATPESLTWFQSVRLRAVELLVYWTGRVNTTDLIRRFDISRPVAMRDIHRYLELAPGNMYYDRKARAYLATSACRPVLTRGLLEEYLALDTAGGGHWETLPGICRVDMPRFHIQPAITRVLFPALAAGTGIETHYRSLEHPEGLQRRLFPHALVYSGFRWHLRAWCDRRQSFRDFTLARMVRMTECAQPRPPEADPDNDVAWHETITVRLGPNPALSDPQRRLIEAEFGMNHGELAITTRAALLVYLLQAYQVPLQPDPDAPTRDRLVLLNREALSNYLW